ncbi:MAG TPA: hypothetical protein VFP05_11400 [Thermomicrobiales bacterium]|nr:hypothetical protein [Thermomicrobiales bacterium]
MAPTRCAHFESNRAPETAIAAAVCAARTSFVPFFYAYYYACQAMLEVRSSGE